MNPDPLDSIWVVLPVHNNAETVKGVALECREIVPNVLIVDDGSRDCEVSALMDGTGIGVIRHEINRGKGQAILTAARAVEKLGGRTIITIDADGQHFPRDLRAFLPVIREDPDCIVLGERDFTADNIPGSSKFGRKFSDFWLKLETGFDLRDTQSGFRAYPVRHLLALNCAGRKYDFEVEVLARASWAGLPIRNVPIGVWYPPDGERISSFRPFMDNLWLTHRHALLVMRRALPIPHRKLVTTPKMRGNALGFWFFITAIRTTGLRGAYGLLYLVCLWYALFDSAIVQAALAYLTRRFPKQSPLRQRWNVYQLFIAQGRALIDRYHLLNGGHFDFTRFGFEVAAVPLQEGRGLILLNSHAGNWQASFVAIENWDKPLHILMRPNEHPVRDQKLRIYDEQSALAAVHIINSDRFLGGTVEVMNALQKGDVVCIMGDRDYGGRKVAVTFLGDNAQFPCGPFVIAHAARCPVSVLLSAKTGTHAYEFAIAGTIEHRPGEPRAEFLKRGVQEYATLLERHFEKHPFQCFLFQDVWTCQKPVTA